MRVLSVSEFEANLDEILKCVEAGETFDIARDGKAIAEIAPNGQRTRRGARAIIDDADVGSPCSNRGRRPNSADGVSPSPSQT
jgi:antitoxin (DNA-binding transcriptional repressor) of toxin-antitoxin stability system